MIATSIYILSVSAITLLQQIPTINAASGDISAISKTEWDSLSSSLSTDASLHSIQNSDYKTCRSLGSDAYALSDGANGICMHSHDCAYEFCLRERGVYDLPSYVIDARTEGDITKVSTRMLNNKMLLRRSSTDFPKMPNCFNLLQFDENFGDINIRILLCISIF